MQPPPLPPLAATDTSLRPYSPAQVAVATFLGSPLPGFWLISRNYNMLGKKGKAVQMVVLGMIVTAASFGLALVLPENTPGMALTLLYCLGMMFTARKMHGPLVEQHERAGGRLGSWWMVVGVGLLGMVILLAVVLGLIWPDIQEALLNG